MLLILVTLICLLMMAALGVDVAKVVAGRSQLQSAADAAALAGATRFTSITAFSDTGVTQAAQSVLERNPMLDRKLSQGSYEIGAGIST